MRIAIVSDAWAPQVNGVVRTLSTTIGQLRGLGHAIETITPDQFATMACPSYPEIRLALGCGRRVRRRLEDAAADAVHIATEGPLGWAARRWCLDRVVPFTTSFHTRFPDYVALRTGLPPGLFWPTIRRFHAPAERVMVATPTLAAELRARGLARTHIWSRGVDLALFRRDAVPATGFGRPGTPTLLYVGRVATEKNIEAFLDADVAGEKLVVGDGPARAALESRHPQARFTGALSGEALAGAYAAADVLVFPSRTDTFGLVMIEALAAGLPVAALPVAGPLDILGRNGRGRGVERVGVLDEDLAVAIRRALTLSRQACRAEAEAYDWQRCTDQFLAGLAPLAKVRPVTAPNRASDQLANAA